MLTQRLLTPEGSHVYRKSKINSLDPSGVACVLISSKFLADPQAGTWNPHKRQMLAGL